ncbi:hypothetical protein F511_36469 [Dorcoceras hygrometricum]|uniref:Uncharacterized protein n=1 Tax=Dorcoceras hygrometricum TaxID=472368 RepID=A0A2Z7B794_9LAMI|nr:hypothetical protein F511_36469 [Dorcoceras hygrometricum]
MRRSLLCVSRDRSDLIDDRSYGEVSVMEMKRMFIPAAAAADRRRRRRRRFSRRKIVSGQLDEENPFVQKSSVLLVQADEGVSVLVVDRIGDIYRSIPRRADVIVTTIGARHKCQQDQDFKASSKLNPISGRQSSSELTSRSGRCYLVSTAQLDQLSSNGAAQPLPDQLLDQLNTARSAPHSSYQISIVLSDQHGLTRSSQRYRSVGLNRISTARPDQHNSTPISTARSHQHNSTTISMARPISAQPASDLISSI